jgi:hypothetical protein
MKNETFLSSQGLSRGVPEQTGVISSVTEQPTKQQVGSRPELKPPSIYLLCREVAG